MSEELLVIVMLESVGESEGEVGSEESALISLISISMIIDSFSDPMPSNTLLFLYFVAKTKDFHSIIVQGVRFGQVQDVEFYFLTLCCIGASEEIPLGVSIGVYVVLKHQVVLIFGYFDCGKQIARLKARLKDKGFIVWTRGLVELLRWHLNQLSHLSRAHLLEVTFFAIDVVIFDQLFYVDKV